jgi:hypothetical protein
MHDFGKQVELKRLNALLLERIYAMKVVVFGVG